MRRAKARARVVDSPRRPRPEPQAAGLIFLTGKGCAPASSQAPQKEEILTPAWYLPGVYGRALWKAPASTSKERGQTLEPGSVVRMLGIDPGTAICGWGIVDKVRHEPSAQDYGAVVTQANLPAELRLKMIYTGLIEIIDRYQPEYGAVEKLFFGQNSKTALAVGQARGVVLLALSQSGIPLVEMSPAEVKQTVAGYGRADKKQVQMMVMRLLHLDAVPQPDDVADALAIAITGLEWVKYQEAVRD